MDKVEKMPGYQLFSSIGKKVLRPGGVALTEKLIDGLAICAKDTIVEFAPGLGKTAQLVILKKPKAYIGVELDDTYAAALRKKLFGKNIQIISGNSSNTTLAANFATKAFGEAMLTMQVDHRKAEIISEGYRILKVGGLYGIHELALSPTEISEGKKAEIQRALAEVMKVNARPLTVLEWELLFKSRGFKVLKTETFPMELLNISRVIKDEGFFRTLKIGINILLDSKKRKRMLAIKKVLTKYKANLIATAIVAQKV